MVMVNGVKFSCAPCIRGHRSANCVHPDRPLTEIRKKGRPPTQCAHCRELRKTKQLHAKCICPKEEEKPLIVLPNGASGLESTLSEPSPPPHASTSTAVPATTDHLKPLQMLEQEHFAVPGRALSRRSSSARSIGTPRSYASSQSGSAQQHDLVHGHVPHHNSAFSPYAAPHAHGPRIARTSSTSSSRSHRTESSVAPDLATPAATPQMMPSSSSDLSADIEALFQQFDPSALRDALEATVTTNTANEVWLGGERIPIPAVDPAAVVPPPPPVDFALRPQQPLPVRSELVDLHDSVQSVEGFDLDEDIAKWASDLAEFDWTSFSLAGNNPLARVSPPGGETSPGIPIVGDVPATMPASDTSSSSNASSVPEDDDDAKPDPDRERIPLWHTRTLTVTDAEDLQPDPDRERIPLWQTKTVTVANSNSGDAFDLAVANQDQLDEDDDDEDEEEGRQFYDKDNPGQYAAQSDSDDDDDDEEYSDDEDSPWQQYANGAGTPNATSFVDLRSAFEMRGYAPSSASSSSVASLDDFEHSASNSEVAIDDTPMTDDPFDLVFSFTGDPSTDGTTGTGRAPSENPLPTDRSIPANTDLNFLETVESFDKIDVSSSSSTQHLSSNG